jgi:hypothetical protein
MALHRSNDIEDRVSGTRTKEEMTGKDDQKRGDMSAKPVTHKQAIQMSVNAKSSKKAGKSKRKAK